MNYTYNAVCQIRGMYIDEAHPEQPGPVKSMSLLTLSIVFKSY